MANCIGHPYCTATVDSPNVACRVCWFLIPKRLRSQLTALIFKNPNSKLRDEIFEEAIDYLHPILEKQMKRKVEKAIYTVVPYKGVRKRRPNRLTYEKKLKAKYYGGPWDYQK